MLGQVEIQWKAGGREGSLQVQAVYSARKTMGLEVKPDGRIYARFPRRTPDKTARTFIREHSRWIVEKWLMMEQRREKTSASSLFSVPSSAIFPQSSGCAPG